MKADRYKEVLENTTNREWTIVNNTPENVQLTSGCYTLKVSLFSPQYNQLNFELVDRASDQVYSKKGVKQTSTHYTSEFQEFIADNT